MLELASELLGLLRAGTPVAVVTVTRVIRSAPRGIGASLAVTPDARVIGSISGGCVENDAVMLGLEALRTGRTRVARLGLGDDAASAAGLACGGAIEVLAYPLAATDAAADTALEAAATGKGVSVGVVASGADAGSILSGADLAPLRGRGSRMLTAAYDGADVLVLSSEPPAQLIVLGAGEHAAALCRVGAAAGFAVTVCDAWALLVTRDRFPAANTLVVGSPHAYLAGLDPEAVDDRTAICVLTHDEREDVPTLRIALGLPAGFVGAMGARSTVARRAELLRTAGVPDDQLARLHSPLGLDLGGATPEETAVAVIAQIIARRHDGSARPLRDSTGPIHRRDGSSAAGCVAPVPVR